MSLFDPDNVAVKMHHLGLSLPLAVLAQPLFFVHVFVKKLQKAEVSARLLSVLTLHARLSNSRRHELRRLWAGKVSFFRTRTFAYPPVLDSPIYNPRSAPPPPYVPPSLPPSTAPLRARAASVRCKLRIHSIECIGMIANSTRRCCCLL